MDLVEEVARAVHEAHNTAPYPWWHTEADKCLVAPHIAAAVIPIVLEAAAKVADGYKCSLRPGSIDRLHGHSEAAKDIAKRIRALASEGGSK
jgi:hypothetical protein